MFWGSPWPVAGARASGSFRVVGMLVAGMLLTGCGSEEAPPTATGDAAPATPVSVASESPTAAAAPAPERSAAELLEAANAALAADRLFLPAGDSALELFVAAKQAARDEVADPNAKERRNRRLMDSVGDGGVANQALVAINDLFPYGRVFVDQAIRNGELEDAGRVLGLLEQLRPESASLSSLRQQLQRSSARAERLAAAAPSVAAPAAPSTPPAAPLAARPAAQTPASSASAGAPVAAAPLAQPAAPEARPAPPAVPAAAAPEQPIAAVAEPPQAPAAPAAPAAQPEPAAPAVAAPRLLSSSAPRYPTRALRAKIEGWVSLRLRVEADGRVDEVEVIASEPEGIFDREAVSAAKRWRFEASGQSHAVDRRVDFRLEG